MVNPAWFFSTLAQATAAIVGLLVSLSAIQYQLERQRRERRTEDLRDETIEFKEKYTDIIPSITSEFAQHADISFLGLSMDMTVPADSLHGYIVMRSYFNQSSPVATVYWIHFARIGHILLREINPSADPRQHHLLSDDAFDRLRESSGWLSLQLKGESQLLEQLYGDIGITGDNKYTQNAFDPNPPGESVQEWLQRYQSYAERHNVLLSGENLQSFVRVAEELNGDFQRLDSLKENTVITFNPNIGAFLVKSLLLLLVGVFLPTASLISDVPSLFSGLVIDDFLLYLYEVFLTLATFLIVISLLTELQDQFDSTGLQEALRTELHSTKSYFKHVSGFIVAVVVAASEQTTSLRKYIYRQMPSRLRNIYEYLRAILIVTGERINRRITD
jgi:hypothetical protein